MTLWLAAGCKADDEGKDNVASCEAWVQAQQCGGRDFAGETDCSEFELEGCDMSDYFDCLTAHTVCSEGELRTDGWMACIPLTACD